ncbi:MAG: hypothetical protein ACLQCB_13385 [Spirochaetia bacterium]
MYTVSIKGIHGDLTGNCDVTDQYTLKYYKDLFSGTLLHENSHAVALHFLPNDKDAKDAFFRLDAIKKLTCQEDSIEVDIDKATFIYEDRPAETDVSV